MPYPGLVHPEPLPLQQATADPHLHKRCSNIALAQSLWVSGSWCTQGLFESSEHLWQVRGLILNMTSPLLPSCWGFSFALGRGVSFFGGIQHSPVDGCSATCCNLECSQEMRTCPSTLPSFLLRNDTQMIPP